MSTASDADPAAPAAWGSRLRIFNHNKGRFRMASRLTVVVLLAVAYAMIPLNLTDANLHILSFCGVIAVAAIGIVLLSGYGGQLSFAQPAFMATGAYTAIELGGGHGVNFVLYLLSAVVLCAALGLVIGLIALRLDGPQLAIVTFGVLLFSQYLEVQYVSLTGGDNGRALGKAPMSIGGLDLRAIGGLTSSQSWFYVVWFIVVLVVLATARILRARPGYALDAIRLDWHAAQALGVDVRREKLKAFAWSSALGGLAGVLFVGLQGFAAPSDFGIDNGVLILAVLAIGGARSLGGTVLGAIVVWGGKEFVSTHATQTSWLSSIITTPGSHGGILSPGDLVTLAYGALLVVVLLIDADGLAGMARHRYAILRRKTVIPAVPPSAKTAPQAIETLPTRVSDTPTFAPSTTRGVNDKTP